MSPTFSHKTNGKQEEKLFLPRRCMKFLLACSTAIPLFFFESMTLSQRPYGMKREIPTPSSERLPTDHERKRTKLSLNQDENDAVSLLRLMAAGNGLIEGRHARQNIPAIHIEFPVVVSDDESGALTLKQGKRTVKARKGLSRPTKQHVGRTMPASKRLNWMDSCRPLPLPPRLPNVPCGSKVPASHR